MIDIHILASSSKGNAYIIGENDSRLIIDPGIRFNDLLKRSGFNLAADACLISHEHKDHCRSAADIVKVCGIDIYCSAGTGKFIDAPFKSIQSETEFHIKDWRILPFEVQHDAAEPLGFLIESPSRQNKILYATDTYYIRYVFSGITHFLVEANYQKELLDTNPDMHPIHKERVRRSHFEIENLAEFYRHQDLSKTKAIYLIHLSDDNSDEIAFQKKIEGVTGIPTYLTD